jgi:hypothetical protein
VANNRYSEADRRLEVNHQLDSLTASREGGNPEKKIHFLDLKNAEQF